MTTHEQLMHRIDHLMHRVDHLHGLALHMAGVQERHGDFLLWIARKINNDSIDDPRLAQALADHKSASAALKSAVDEQQAVKTDDRPRVGGVD